MSFKKIPEDERVQKSNFFFIEQNFSDIIEEVREGAQGKKSDSRMACKTIVFKDMSKLYCVEYFDKKGTIELFWYDFYGSDIKVIMKFHGHYHDDEASIKVTKYDPYHIHDVNDNRYFNEKYRELNDILEFIRTRQISLKGTMK